MEKIKYWLDETIKSQKGKDILIVLIVILVGIASFELGRLSKENASNGLQIGYPSQDNVPADTNSTQTSRNISNTDLALNNKTFFASTKGTKYYTISCSGGKTIKQENRVYFDTGEEAEQAGYTLSGSCN